MSDLIKSMVGRNITRDKLSITHFRSTHNTESFRAKMKYIFLLLLVVPVIWGDDSPKLPDDEKALQELEDRLVHGLTEFILTGEMNDDVKDALHVIRSPGVFRGLENEPEPSVCLLCKVAARLLILYRKTGVPVEDIKGALQKLCVQAKIETDAVCAGVIELNAPIFIYIIDNKQNLTVDSICSTIAQPAYCPIPPGDGNWSVSLPSPTSHSHTPVNSKYQLKTNHIVRDRDSAGRNLRILQITDLHFDELYEPGSNAECGEPLCCGKHQGTPATPAAAAGNWGDYRSCDMPWYTVLDLLQQVKKHNIDYVYYTGDIINHRVWETSMSNNVKNIKKVNAEFRNTFHSTPVFSILGNHEPNPVNEYAQNNLSAPELSTQWLYDLVADEWKYWLPEDSLQNIRKGGYYTTLVRPGFRIIGLNSNVAYTFNWWLLFDHTMLQDQLQWLTDTLTDAESAGEKVHILSHVPSGDNTCLIKWSQEYNKIIQRFAHIISAQFVGHTHYDEMNLFFNNSNVNEPINVVFNGGSFTTYTNVNPNYIIYEVNPQTLEVEDYEQWIYNITEANLNSLDVHPRWFKLYSFKEAYGLKSMHLQDLGNLIQNMASNQTLLDQYYRFKMRDGDLAMQEGCDQKCHESNLCKLVTTQYGVDNLCNQLLEKYRSTIKQK